MKSIINPAPKICTGRTKKEYKSWDKKNDFYAGKLKFDSGEYTPVIQTNIYEFMNEPRQYHKSGVFEMYIEMPTITHFDEITDTYDGKSYCEDYLKSLIINDSATLYNLKNKLNEKNIIISDFLGNVMPAVKDILVCEPMTNREAYPDDPSDNIIDELYAICHCSVMIE